MSFDKEMTGDVTVLTPKNNLMGGKETTELVAAIEEIAAQSPPKIVVDLGKVSYMNSTGLGALVRANTHCGNRGGWLRIARAGSRIKNVFLVTKLVFVFDTYESVEDAIQGAQKKSS
jgi:anti-sigma B factor antagonist